MKCIVDESDIRNQNGNYIIYCYTVWMPKTLSGMMMRMLEKVELETSIPVLGCDVDVFVSTKQLHEVTRVPTLVFMSDGKVLKKIEGQPLISAYRPAVRDAFKIRSDI